MAHQPCGKSSHRNAHRKRYHTLTLEPELIDEVAQEALRHLNRRSAEHTVTLAVPDDLLMAKMDPQLIVQVLINLTDNAIKYTPAGSSIAVSAQRSGETVRVEVADDGPGIPDAAKEKLFEMFYTAQAKRGDGRRGLGLGLSLCRSIVEAHGGQIGVRDNNPHGTVFWFTLPASDTPSARRKTDRLYCKNVFFRFRLTWSELHMISFSCKAAMGGHVCPQRRKGSEAVCATGSPLLLKRRKYNGICKAR
ncbi:MAG: sensor histidine kinase [Ruthenibacterium lactatiformans]